MDFQGKTFTGLGGPAAIGGVNETSIIFSGHGVEDIWTLWGTLDRVTGSLIATLTNSNPNTKKIVSTLTYDLQCKPTQRMF